MMKRIISIMLALSILFSFVSIRAELLPPDYSYTADNGVKYDYDAKTRTLTISGEGEIRDAFSAKYLPFFDELYYQDYDEGVTNLIIGEGITSISGCSFQLWGVENVTLPSTLKKIGAMAFEWSDIKNINLPEGLEEIGNMAFAWTQIENITIPSTVNNIGFRAFEDTPWYESLDDEFVIVGDNVLIKYNGTDSEVIIPDGVRVICDAFKGYDDSPVKTVKMPKSVEILNGTFNECDIENIELHEGITAIGERTFRGNNLKELVMPASLKYVAYHSFCESSAQVRFLGPKPQIGGMTGVGDDPDDCRSGAIRPQHVIEYNGYFEDSWNKDGKSYWKEMSYEIKSTFAFDPYIDETIEPKCKGDVDGDGEVTSADATQILRYVADLVHLNSRQIEAANLTGDTVSSSDATMILRTVAKLETIG